MTSENHYQRLSTPHRCCLFGLVFGMVVAAICYQHNLDTSISYLFHYSSLLQTERAAFAELSFLMDKLYLKIYCGFIWTISTSTNYFRSRCDITHAHNPPVMVVCAQQRSDWRAQLDNQVVAVLLSSASHLLRH